MATPNYSYEKRQRELAKKKKNEEKRLRKAQGKPDLPDDGNADGGAGESAAADDAPPAAGPAEAG